MRVPSTNHVGENGLRHLQIPCLSGKIEGPDPCQSPPTLVVVVLVEEVRVRILIKGLAQDFQILSPVLSHNHVLNGFNTICRVPPACCIPPALIVVPSLQR